MHDIALEGIQLAEKAELERMYRSDFNRLRSAERIERIRTVLESRLEQWETSLLNQYRELYRAKYRGKDLENASRFAVSHRLAPVRREIRSMLTVNIAALYAECLSGAGEELYRSALENAAAGIVWWEDAPCMALMMFLLGFAKDEKNIRHLVMDEAQDYSACALSMLKHYYPLANVTLLGDPKQRTTPGMPMLDVRMWNECFKLPNAPLIELTRCYRSTLNITRLCNAILPDADQVVPFGREGENPELIPLSDENVIAQVKKYTDMGMGSIAVITRTLAQADRLSRIIPNAHLLDGSDEDILSDPGDIAVGGYQLMKGLEFDAVVAAWPYARLSDGERRRLYTACSRALHRLTLCADEKLIAELGIIL
ncbi:MAG: ATP-binding domain-containing protein [Clostridia bacterium]|nr:ATP-binding domain-containing protein [Clostridia bacterium]